MKRIFSVARWQVTVPELPSSVDLCLAHVEQLRATHPHAEVRLHFDTFQHPRGCEACLLLGRPVTVIARGQGTRKSCTQFGTKRRTA